MPPAPIGARISYEPRRVPGVRIMVLLIWLGYVRLHQPSHGIGLIRIGDRGPHPVMQTDEAIRRASSEYGVTDEIFADMGVSVSVVRACGGGGGGGGHLRFARR